MNAKQYRKKPVVIWAMEYDGENQAEIVKWAGGKFESLNGHLVVSTLEGLMTVSPGDYVIRGVQGEFYPCKPDIFEAIYEPA